MRGKDTVPVSSPQTPYLYTHTFQADYGRQFLRKLFATCSVGRPPTALRSLNGFATLAWSVFPLHNLLLLALRSSSQLLLLGFCSYRAKAYSHAGCALAPSRCSHQCVEFSAGLFRNVCKQNSRRLLTMGVRGRSPCKGRQPVRAEPNTTLPGSDPTGGWIVRQGRRQIKAAAKECTSVLD